MHIRPLSILLGILLTWQAGAFEAPESLKKIVNELIPGLTADRIEESPIKGIYEVWLGPHLLYVSEDGKFMMRGDIVDLESRTNLTASKRDEARFKAVDALGESNMIVFSPKQGTTHTVTVFTDVDCGYCAKLHREMAEYNELGIKVRYLAFPRAGIPSGSYQKTVSVWCATDPKKAIGAAKAGQPIEPKECPNPVADHYEMGRTIGVRGTPSMVLENGQMIPGYVPPQELLRLLREGKTS